MGLQQILFILLSVIVVGAAISISVVMFDNQAIQSERSLIVSEVQHFAVLAQGYFRTVTMTGGAGGNLNAGDEGKLARFINSKAVDDKIENNLGIFTVKIIDAEKANITILGESKNRPEIKVLIKVNLKNEAYGTGAGETEAINIDLYYKED